MKTLLLFAATSALCLAACSKHDANNTSATDNSMMANDMAATNTDMSANDMATAPAPTSAQAFANAAAASDKFEIESSKLAESAAQSSSVKSFAKQMISAHTETTAKLKKTLAGMQPAMTPDDTLSADQQAMLDGLKGKKGADFDSAYKDAQVNAHQKTLDALNAYASGGDNPKLQDLAKATIPTVTAHLNMAKGLK